MNIIPGELSFCIEEALEKLYNDDRYLIKNRVHERSIVFRFGLYFYQCLQKTSYREYYLDSEYNRNLQDKKRTKNFMKGTYPDLILHKRGTNENNLLIMEFKTWWNTDKNHDIEKLKDFLNRDETYRYKYGAFILLGKEKPKIRYFWRE